ncbi:MAG: MFS transporter [Anaerolineales bacterium]|nr:MFS transporter [Anaerolineales bacterium]
MNTNRRNVYILSLTLVVIMLGFGMVMPIMPFYIENLGAGGSELGLLIASYATMRLIFAPIWGGISDRHGRKPILMIGILGYGIAMILFGLSTNLWMLFVSRILSGILSSATSPTTMAYIGDSTSEEERGGGMGLLGAAMGVGTILGPALGGLLGSASLSMPFFIAGGTSFLTLGLVAVFLPESLPPEKRQPAKEQHKTNPLRDLWASIFSPIGILLFMAFISTCGLMIFYGIFGLYAAAKFDFGPKEIGWIFMVFGLISAITQGLLVGPLTKRWGESPLIKISLLATAVAFMLISLADSVVTVMLTIGFFTLTTALLSPAVTSLTSKRATMDQGITMGLSNVFISLGRIAGPLLAGVLFDWQIEYPYYSGAVIMVLGFVVSLIWISTSRPKTLATQ